MKALLHYFIIIGFALILQGGLTGCSTMKKIFAAETAAEDSRPISNPFGNFYSAERERYQNVVLRTKKGDRAVEVELPRDVNQFNELVVPISPELLDQSKRSPASSMDLDPTYFEKTSGPTDREITKAFPQGSGALEADRDQIEKQLGLTPVESETDVSDTSYLSSIDKVKQLYVLRRFEAGLIEIDQLLRIYPTDPRLYEMRGTLLSRLGHEDLAMKSWEQALELNPQNASLKKFVERRKGISRKVATTP